MTHGDPMVLGLIPVASVKLVTATRGLVQSPQSAVSVRWDGSCLVDRSKATSLSFNESN
jgi:hypothetical protein